MRVLDIVRAAWPSASPGDANWILWERTPYPMGRVSARYLYRSTASLVRANRNGIRLCDFCDNRAEAEGCMCRACTTALLGEGEGAGR